MTTPIIIGNSASGALRALEATSLQPDHDFIMIDNCGEGSEYLKTFEFHNNRILDANLLIDIPNPQQISKAKRALLKPSVTPEYKADRNALCPCGSGKKYKKCHLT